MTDISGWVIDHEGCLRFLLDGVVKLTWDGAPQLSREHIALVAYAYEQGVQDGGAVTLETLRAWADRLEGIGQDALGLADEMGCDE